VRQVQKALLNVVNLVQCIGQVPRDIAAGIPKLLAQNLRVQVGTRAGLRAVANGSGCERFLAAL
jgi:hypothetical protein